MPTKTNAVLFAKNAAAILQWQRKKFGIDTITKISIEHNTDIKD